MDRQTVLRLLTDNAQEIQQRFSVKTLSIFGSVARGQKTGHSDVDVLVDFTCKTTFDIFMDLKFYLEELIGTPIDLVTQKALRPQVRKAIEKEIIHVT